MASTKCHALSVATKPSENLPCMSISNPSLCNTKLCWTATLSQSQKMVPNPKNSSSPTISQVLHRRLLETRTTCQKNHYLFLITSCMGMACLWELSSWSLPVASWKKSKSAATGSIRPVELGRKELIKPYRLIVPSLSSFTLLYKCYLTAMNRLDQVRYEEPRRAYRCISKERELWATFLWIYGTKGPSFFLLSAPLF